MAKNLYETLNIAKDSSNDIIKKGYRKMSKKHHPDKGGNTQQFQEVSLAYNILSDDAKRKQYDETGQIPKDKPNNFYHKFGELLTKEFLPHVLKTDDIERVDIIKLFKDWVRHNLENFEEKSSEIDKHIHKLKKSLKRIKRKKKQKIAIIEMTIESGISQLENHKIALNEEIDFFKKIYDIMNNYSYKTDKVESIYDDIVYDKAHTDDIKGDFEAFFKSRMNNQWNFP